MTATTAVTPLKSRSAASFKRGIYCVFISAVNLVVSYQTTEVTSQLNLNEVNYRSEIIIADVGNMCLFIDYFCIQSYPAMFLLNVVTGS